MRLLALALALLALPGGLGAADYFNVYSTTTAPATPTGKYLRGDMTWVTVAGGTGATGATGATGSGSSVNGLAIVWLDAPDAIGDWIATDTVDDTDVNLSDDGVVGTATAAVINVATSTGSSNHHLDWVYACPASRAISGYGDIVGHCASSAYGPQYHVGIVQVDASEDIHAKHHGAIAGAVNEAFVLGYIN